MARSEQASDVPPLLPDWRKRLREACDRSPLKRDAIARKAGVRPETLSRIITGTLRHPSFESVVRLAHAAGENVGWLLAEPGYAFSEQERGRLRDAAVTIISMTSAGYLLRKDAPLRTIRRTHPKAYPRHRHKQDP